MIDKSSILMNLNNYYAQSFHLHVCKYEMVVCLLDRGRLRAYIVLGEFVQGIGQG